MEEWEKRFNTAMARRSDVREFPDDANPDLVEKARIIEKIYDLRGYGLLGTPHAWEEIGQTISKWCVVLNNPKKYDKNGLLRAKYEAIIMAFDIATEAFPSNFDVKTGQYKEE